MHRLRCKFYAYLFLPLIVMNFSRVKMMASGLLLMPPLQEHRHMNLKKNYKKFSTENYDKVNS